MSLRLILMPKVFICHPLKSFIKQIKYAGRIHIRKLSTSKATNWWTRSDIRTIPNMITASRILASPLLSVAIIYDMKLTALSGCLIFAFSDWLDGYIAKRYDQQTVLGAYLDPFADKCMIGALTLGLLYQQLIPLPLAGLIISRDLFLLGSSLIIRARRKEKDVAFFDVVATKLLVAPSDISKLNTGVQFVLLGSSLAHFAIGLPSAALLDPLHYITAVTTFWSGIGYLDGSGMAEKEVIEVIKEEQRTTEKKADKGR